MNTKNILISLVLLTASASAAAEGERKERRGPPQEAITACEAQAAEAMCSFTGRQSETITGVCLAPPRGDSEVLACVPDSHRNRASRDREARDQS